MSNKYKNISVISTGSWVPSTVDSSKNTKGTYQVQINKLILKMSIGIHEHEKKKKQRGGISLSIKALDNLNIVNESISNVISYENIIKNLKAITAKGHIELLETLGDKILSMCFEDKRVLSIWMKLEKLDVFKDTESVGIEIVRDRTDSKGITENSTNIERIKKK